MSRTSSPARVVAIGLDSADPDLMLRLCESGDLPTLARLRAQGTWGRLETFAGLGDDAVWCSFATGMHPGHHGRYHFLQFDGEHYRHTRVGDRFVKIAPFWATLSEAGRSVCVIDVPKSPLTPGLNGIQLSDWRVHGRDGPTRSSPAELASRVIATHGDDRNDITVDGRYLCSPWSLDEQARQALAGELMDSIERKTDLLEEFLKERRWDLFLGVFKESHCAGHQFWDLIDSCAQAGAPVRRRRAANPVVAVYRALDRAIARLLRWTDDDTTVIVFSTLGMRSNRSGEHLLESALLRLEPNPLLRLWSRILGSEAGGGRRRRLLQKVDNQLRRFRSAIQVPHNELSGAIRINLRGRERYGRVPSGAGYRQCCERLARQLQRLRDPATGEPIVSEVIHARTALPGPGAEHLPDLLVVWNRAFPIDGACSPAIGEIRRSAPPYRPGNHIPGGAFFTIGPTVGRGTEHHGSSIMDLAPTMAATLNVTLPATCGVPIAAVAGHQPVTGTGR